MPTPSDSPLALALGRVPSGLYIVTTRHGGETVGFLGSFVMQMGFSPPTVCVAVAKDRVALASIRAVGRFGLSVLDPESRGVMKGFLRRLPEGESPFDGLELRETPSGTPVLAGALAWLDCRTTGEFETGDHVAVFAEVTEGRVLRAGEPSTHVRRSGLGY